MKLSEKYVELLVFLLFVLISLLCIIIIILPTEMQETLKARSDHWNPIASFISIFVHANFEHLSGNILSFLSFGFLVYMINQKSNRKAFLTSLLLIVLFLPLIHGFLLTILLSSRTIVSCGLSIVVAGVIGLIVPSLCVFLRN